MLLKFILKRLPIIDPLMKLVPIIKLTGKLTVSSNNRSTLLLLELFCMPIINKKNKQELKIKFKNNFWNWNGITLFIWNLV